MSTALVRKALELVDQEDSGTKKRGRAAQRSRQRESKPYKAKKHKQQTPETPPEQTVDDNIRKLLALSKPSTDAHTADKIIKRAVKGKPLLEKIEIKKEVEKSILFAEEDEALEKLQRKLKRKRN